MIQIIEPTVYSISDCPITGLQRKVVKTELLNSEVQNIVRLTCYVEFYKNGEKVNSKYINGYIKELTAKTDTPVNKLTGQILGEDTPEIWNDENTVSEYVYFKTLETMSVKQSDIKAMIIATRDAEGKFNV